MFAQIGTSADNSVLSVATNSLISVLNASMNDIQLANMVYSLCAGAFMIVGGMLGIIIGWNKNFRIGASLVLVGEVILAISQNIETFTWGGRLVVGLGSQLDDSFCTRNGPRYIQNGEKNVHLLLAQLEQPQELPLQQVQYY